MTDESTEEDFRENVLDVCVTSEDPYIVIEYKGLHVPSVYQIRHINSVICSGLELCSEVVQFEFYYDSREIGTIHINTTFMSSVIAVIMIGSILNELANSLEEELTVAENVA